jgi:hypothetical protein
MSIKRKKQDNLPGIQDNKIEQLHAAALEYVAVRDERMEWTKKEVPLKEKVLKLMIKHAKDKYICEGVEIYREFPEETVKVRVQKAKET